MKACAFGLCGFSISIGLNPLTFNFDGADVYTHGQSQILTCEGQYGAPFPRCSPIMTCSAGFLFNFDTCECEPGTPILIDVDNSGFHLTSVADGTVFDLGASGSAHRYGWTSPDSRTAFLALDRNWNGIIDNGKELFGNFTSQPKSIQRNGFLALAEFDKAENGGNGDGVIDRNDNVFPMLRLWTDRNHDGISQPEELHSLISSGITTVELQYTESRRVDEFGNQFRYRALVRTADGGNRLVWDVVLATR